MGLIQKFIPFIMKDKQSIFTKLIVQGTGYSTRAVLVLAAVILGGLLLTILMVGMIVDLCYNHTFTVNLSDAALLIGSVTSLWTAAGISKAIGHTSKHAEQFDEYNEEVIEEPVEEAEEEPVG